MNILQRRHTQVCFILHQALFDIHFSFQKIKENGQLEHLEYSDECVVWYATCTIRFVYLLIHSLLNLYDAYLIKHIVNGISGYSSSNNGVCNTISKTASVLFTLDEIGQ